jgi:hypothetical protein
MEDTMTCWRESPIRRIGEADKMTCKQKRPEKEALRGTSCDRGRYGDRYGDVSATISATSHRCELILGRNMLNVHHTNSGKYMQKVKELYFIPQQEKSPRQLVFGKDMI